MNKTQPQSQNSQIPVTLLTGFLGAGKTTLLNHILATSGERVFVIENEFGPVNIDADLLISERSNVIELTGGCLCCTIRGDLTRHLVDLLARRESGELAFDRLVIETTGLADPTPVVQTFFGDARVAAGYLLDAVLVVVDGVHAHAQLDAHPVVRKQIGFADRLLISKSELIEPAQLDALVDRLSAINPGAPQRLVVHGAVPLEELLDIRGFNLREEETPAAHYRPAGKAAAAFAPRHREDIAAVLLAHDGALDLERIGDFMQGLLDTMGDRLLRYKGTLAIEGEPRRLIVQGVHRLAAFDYASAWRADETPRSRIVLIGLDLPVAELEAGFRATIAQTGAALTPATARGDTVLA